MEMEWLPKISQARSVADYEVLLQEAKEENPQNNMLICLLTSQLENAVEVKELKEKEARNAGTYFSRIDQVFVKDSDVNLQKLYSASNENAQHYQGCCRLKFKAQTEEEEGRKRKQASSSEESETSQRQIACRTHDNVKPNDVYVITHNAAKKPNSTPATKNGQSRTSTHNNQKTAIWKTEVVGHPFDETSQIAHLVPASVVNANSYWFVTDFLFGIDSSRQWNEIACLIHGTNEEGADTKREKHTGIKHMVTNKILLSGRRPYFDYNPCVIFLPIMTLEDAKNWTGGGYDAIMMIDMPLDTGYEEDIKMNKLQNVVQTTHFHSLTKEHMGNGIDLSKAATLLREYTRAILYAQYNKKPKDAEFDIEKRNTNATAFYPKVQGDVNAHKVPKISFQDNGTPDGHPAPDPILLLTKSIAVLQKRHGFDIVAAAAEPSNQSDLSLQAMEEYLVWQEKHVRAPNPIGFDIFVS